uniref:receptor protein-tyrosine kinase n=1 Tax=Cyprinus carpio TaxID=7962 RepID=A0A8C2IMY4_CYPCA
MRDSCVYKCFGWLHFVESPKNVTSSLGKPVAVQCVLRADGEDQGPLDVLWLKEGQPLEFADTNQMQFPEDENGWLVFSELKIEEVQLSDMGSYQCAVSSVFLSPPGLPHFSVEPQDLSVVANEELSLRCVAHGPPDPVRVIWLQDGAPLNNLNDPISLSPSTLNISGLNKTSSFSCEAHNRKGVASSGTGVVTVLPSQPHDIKAEEITNSSIRLSWHMGFGGIYPISHCIVQVKASGEDSDQVISSQTVSAPVISCLISDLEVFSQYDLRVACRSSQGVSNWTAWMSVSTSEGGKHIEAFEPMMESGELVVRYRARRTYSRRTAEATLNSLGISDELKQKLQDVMVDRHKLTLGKTLGEGEFGSVMEGSLTQEDSVLKVAVKTMKIAICTRTEMEDFLREAACMKEFDHQNVMRLLGVCLQTVESEGYPSPVVILPYMKHGDLHSYLLYSRLGDAPVYLPSQMLVKFMTDIARGMEYLSGKNFIHRDLAARNCMLNENMNVCVADFGLSKKIYNGDYYRQGRISKMPVKWIAIESLADRVYTTKSDVWSFGVTMWEIATRGQTPYPGVENSEIYDYLRQGNRLKQPPDCLDSIYSLMFSCWLLSPKDRPSFEILCCELEKVLEDLPSQDPDEILYVNMEETSGELGAVGGWDPIMGVPCALGALKGSGSVATVEVHPPSRYVICPQHENQRLLNADSMESLNLTGFVPTPLLQPSSRSTPVPCEGPSPEERDEKKKVP